ncbi:MAG: 23S rRNA (pseudouridine(1915)-N(3))-methyltransferase RlmH [Eubacteriales bacterium]|nr:23S rRNA (pseudouridine(1915)-N(3))-methyltransferase RlmH [Eubacteriales bacterium]
MLHVRLICVGKLKEKFYREACAEYEKRLQGYCKLDIVELAEQRLPEHPSQLQLDAALAKEADVIRAKIPSGSRVVAMCIEGKTLSSEQFADQLKGWMDRGTSHISILIGGSCGLDAQLKHSAQLRLSMSPMTFPHHLARVMTLEQLYRALNIAAGGKYHK